MPHSRLIPKRAGTPLAPPPPHYRRLMLTGIGSRHARPVSAMGRRKLKQTDQGVQNPKSARSSSVLPVPDNCCKQILLLNQKIHCHRRLTLLVCVICRLGGRVTKGGCRKDNLLPSGFAQSVARTDVEHWATFRQENVKAIGKRCLLCLVFGEGVLVSCIWFPVCVARWR